MFEPSVCTPLVPPPISSSYLVIALPWLVGADQFTVRLRSPNVMLGAAGRSGSVSGVTGDDGPLHGPQPASLCARTWNDTGTPLGSPVNTWLLVTPSDCALAPPSVVTWMSSIGLPFAAACPHVTVAVAFVAVACGVGGAPGRPTTSTVSWPLAWPASVSRASRIV